MTAPSNANTSGLEVVAWRWREKGTPMDWRFEGDAPTHQDLRWNEAEPLVTAASAQARIDGQDRRIKALEKLGVEQSLRVMQQATRAKDAETRATAAEARADRLAKGMPDLSSVIGWLANGCDPTHAVTELRILQARIDHALQQETQP